MTGLFWMTNDAVNELHASLEQNLQRYRDGNFDDLAETPSWCQKKLLDYDETTFLGLSGSSTNDLDDSLIVFGQLHLLESRLATWRNIWIRIAHTELLEYGRIRWLDLEKDDQALAKDIDTHFFRGGVTGCRDDNVAGRLWWTGFIGSRIAGTQDIHEIRQVMEPFMRTADTRQAVIERSGLFSERGLAGHISEYLMKGRLNESTKEKVFRSFIKSVNFQSNGRFFGDMSQDEVFEFLDRCR